ISAGNRYSSWRYRPSPQPPLGESERVGESGTISTNTGEWLPSAVTSTLPYRHSPVPNVKPTTIIQGSCDNPRTVGFTPNTSAAPMSPPSDCHVPQSAADVLIPSHYSKKTDVK